MHIGNPVKSTLEGDMGLYGSEVQAFCTTSTIHGNATRFPKQVEPWNSCADRVRSRL